jgi:hypothetical protein
MSSGPFPYILYETAELQPPGETLGAIRTSRVLLRSGANPIMYINSACPWANCCFPARKGPETYFKNLFVFVFNDVLINEPAHRVYDDTCGATINSSRKRDEEACLLTSPKVIPKPTSRTKSNF